MLLRWPSLCWLGVGEKMRPKSAPRHAPSFTFQTHHSPRAKALSVARASRGKHCIRSVKFGGNVKRDESQVRNRPQGEFSTTPTLPADRSQTARSQTAGTPPLRPSPIKSAAASPSTDGTDLDGVDVEQALLGGDEAEVDDVDEGPDLPGGRHAADQVLLDLVRQLAHAVW